ncbi:hypothetical protein HK102_014083 [Quaeritorhiza haematococci]|nr:hypothetical protein HK102_014083 [Quaeritorhiza haematococci]
MSTTTAAGLRSSFEASLDLALAITILKSKPPNLSAREYVRAVLACDPTIVPTEPSAPAKDAPRHGSGVGPVSEKEVSVQEERASDQKGKSRRRDDCGHVDESREKERHEASEQLIRDLREELSGVKRKLCETELELDGLKAKDGQTGKKHKKEKRASRSKAATAARHVANSMNDPANAKLLKDSMEFLESVKLLADAVFRKEDEDPAPDSSKTTQIHTVSSLSNKRTEHGEAILSAASKVVKILLDQLEIHTTQIVPKQSQTREHRKPQPFALFMAILGNKPAWHITENSLRHFMKLLKEILGRVTAFTTSPLLNTSEQRSLRLVLSTTVRRILDSITLMTYRIDEMFAMCPDDIHAPLSNSDQTNDPPSVDELPVWWEDDGEDPSEQIKDLAVTLCEQRIEITAAAMCHLLRRVCATAEFLVGEGTANAVELGGKDSDAGADSTGRSATTTSPASFLVDCSTRSRMTGVVYRHLDILEELLNLYERQLAVVQWNANLASKDQDDSLRDVNLGWLHAASAQTRKTSINHPQPHHLSQFNRFHQTQGLRSNYIIADAGRCLQR